MKEKVLRVRFQVLDVQGKVERVHTETVYLACNDLAEAKSLIAAIKSEHSDNVFSELELLDLGVSI